jgi:hypothetical protein
MIQMQQPAGDVFEVTDARKAVEKPKTKAKFMIPEDSVQQLSFVLHRMDSILLDESGLSPFYNARGFPVLADDKDRVSEAYSAAVHQWTHEFAAQKAAEARRRPPLWDLSALVGLVRGSPSLQLCKDVDCAMLVLRQELSSLLVWRKDVFEQRFLPLQHFTHLSVVCSRLARAKGEIHTLVSLLVSQVRALFVECSDENALILHKELLVRRDNATTAYLEIERMHEQNSYLRKELAASRAAGGWTRLVFTLEFQSFEKATRMYTRDLRIYVQKLKDRTNVKNILSMNASELGVEDDPDEPAGGKKKPKMLELVKKQQKLLKHVETKVTTHEDQVRRREDKLVRQQEKYREAVEEYETGVEDLRKEKSIVNARSTELDALKKHLESEQQRLDVVMKAAEKHLAEQQRAIAERFSVLGSLETDLVQQALAVCVALCTYPSYPHRCVLGVSMCFNACGLSR